MQVLLCYPTQAPVKKIRLIFLFLYLNSMPNQRKLWLYPGDMCFPIPAHPKVTYPIIYNAAWFHLETPQGIIPAYVLNEFGSPGQGQSHLCCNSTDFEAVIAQFSPLHVITAEYQGGYAGGRREWYSGKKNLNCPFPTPHSWDAQNSSLHGNWGCAYSRVQLRKSSLFG